MSKLRVCSRTGGGRGGRGWSDGQPVGVVVPATVAVAGQRQTGAVATATAQDHRRPGAVPEVAVRLRQSGPVRARRAVRRRRR